MDFDIFGDGMRIFMDYISRQYKKNQNYKPHPIIRAFEVAIQGIKECENEECTMGFSSEGTDKSVYEPYLVVLQKNKDYIEVKEIRNLRVDKELPIDIMVIVFRLQIQLDKIDGDKVYPQQMADALNEVIPGNNFFALGDRWKEARDLFREKLEKGEIALPRNLVNDKLIEEIKNITYETPWEEYNHHLRSLIGSLIIEKLEDDNVQIVITSPKHNKIEKYKVFDSAIQFMIGKSSEYINLFEKNNNS